MTPLAPCDPRRVTTPISHSSEQGTLPTASLISKQVILYWTRGSNYCSRVSTLMTRSLADSSMINHITRRIPTVSTIPNLAQTIASNLTHGHPTSRRMEDQHSQHSTSPTQHHKDGKTCTTLKTTWLSITNQV
jgi:hypothetical protein